MKFALLGKNIEYSYSKEIHALANNNDYEIISTKEIDNILTKKEFLGLNLTIPYKSEVIKYLDKMDDIVNKIKVCNTIFNNNGILEGYNTDYYGFKAMLDYYKIDVNNKNVMILGSGSTCKTIKVVLEERNVHSVVAISRSVYPTYGNIDEFSSNIDIIINTTPIDVDPIFDYDIFKDSVLAIDVNYNHYKTEFLSHFKKSYNGLYMLVYQAFKTEEIFNHQSFSLKEIEDAYFKIIKEKYNLVLIGMPGCGKTTLAKNLSLLLNKDYIDLDYLIEESKKASIKDIIDKEGINGFRKIENDTINKIKDVKGLIISTGGGIILNEENMNILSKDGIIIFINRNLELIEINESRPLSNNLEKLKALYDERIEFYKYYANYEIANNNSINEALEAILDVMRCL